MAEGRCTPLNTMCACILIAIGLTVQSMCPSSDQLLTRHLHDSQLQKWNMKHLHRSHKGTDVAHQHNLGVSCYNHQVCTAATPQPVLRAQMEGQEEPSHAKSFSSVPTLPCHSLLDAPAHSRKVPAVLTNAIVKDVHSIANSCSTRLLQYGSASQWRILCKQHTLALSSELHM